VASIVAEEGFYDLDAPVRRVAGACVPLPFAANLEQAVVPTADKVAAVVRETVDASS
jgi:acetoin:2,6-dichlorophenolindophenol oxidoreductase subunit beta